VLTYFLIDFEMVSVAPVITGITVYLHYTYILLLLLLLLWFRASYFNMCKYTERDATVSCLLFQETLLVSGIYHDHHQE
jgi:hypothetical protein